MPPSSLYCCHKSASMISAAARNRRISASPRVRPPLALAVGALANSPAPMVPAPTASDVPKKERRLIELFKGLTLSSKWSSRVSTLFMAGSFTLLFDVEVVNDDAVDLLVDFIRGLGTPVASAAIARPRDFVVLLVRGGSLPLWRQGDTYVFRSFSRHLSERGSHVTHNWLCVGYAVSPRDPTRFVIRKPCCGRCIFPKECHGCCPYSHSRSVGILFQETRL